MIKKILLAMSLLIVLFVGYLLENNQNVVTLYSFVDLYNIESNDDINHITIIKIPPREELPDGDVTDLFVEIELTQEEISIVYKFLSDLKVQKVIPKEIPSGGNYPSYYMWMGTDSDGGHTFDMMIGESYIVFELLDMMDSLQYKHELTNPEYEELVNILNQLYR